MIFIKSKASNNADICIINNHKTMQEVKTSAPIYCQKSILINAKPEKVWSVLIDIENWPQWLSMVSEAKLSGPLQENTTFDWKASGMKIHSKLHTVQPNAAIGWTGKVLGIHAIHNWTFQQKNECTEVVVSESMEGFLAKLFKKMMNKSIEKDMILSLELLKKACENYANS